MTDIPAPRSTRTIGLWILLVLIGVAWGSTNIFSKLLVNAGHAPLGLTLAGAVIGAVLTSAVLLARGIRLPLARRHLVFFMVIGMLGTAFPHTASYVAITHLPVGIMAILIALVPIMTFLGALLLGMDRPEPLRVLGLALGTVSVLLLVVPRTSLPDPDDAVWVALAVIVSLSYTAENLYIARVQPDDTGALQTLCGLSWAAVIWLLPAVAATGTWMVPGRLDGSAVYLFAMTLMHLGAYGGFVWLIRRAGPVFAAQVGYVVTLAGVMMGIAVFAESHSHWVWLSLVLMLGGLALVQPRR